MKKIPLFLLIMVLAGCSSSQRVSKPSPEETDALRGFERMREDFEPTELDDDDIQIEETTTSERSSRDYSPNQDIAEVDSIGPGYRIQILQTTDPEEARNVEKDALLRFDHTIYRVFDAPFHKVRVGDFVNWRDAEKVQATAIQKGFRDAWVVRTRVDLRKARSWMEKF